MAKAKVLIVDDSLTMRALVAGMLEKDKDIEVVGMANGADEARDMMRTAKPTVMTLDIEMPGMNGIEYLGEVMSTAPMPVIMFSTLTAKGADSSVEALRLGAVDCYPKPTRATPDEVGAAIGKLGKTVKEAPARFAMLREAAAASGSSGTRTAPFAWNGKIVVVGADIASTKPLFDLLGQLPANGPPVVVIQHMRAELADGIVRKLDKTVAPRVVEASDGLALEPGMIVFARPATHHVYIDKWPGGTIRLLDKPTYAGQRPSVTVLMAMLAKAAAADAIGVLLGAEGEDGTAGIATLRKSGGIGIAPATDGSGALMLGRGEVLQPVKAGALVETVLDFCRG